MKFKFIQRGMYTGHTFEIDHYHPADPSRNLVWLKCLDDDSIQINRYVKITELKLL